MMGEDYTINEDYMARVKQVVDWALDAQLYVILNIHHDEKDFFKNVPTNTKETLKNYKKIWNQIAEVFKDYNDYLMFESLNEEACWGDVFNQWSGSDTGKKEVFDYTYQLNQAFVDVIRASGGNNPERHLLLAGYCTDTDLTCDHMYQLPKDPANRFAVSIHYYNPSTFCILEEDADWGKAQSTWGTQDEIKDLNNKFDKIKSTYIDKGIPVIIGEYGAATKNKEYNSVKNFLYSVCKASYDRQITPVLWDVTDGFYDRKNAKMADPVLRDMLNSVKN
jgi:endoglucanase